MSLIKNVDVVLRLSSDNYWLKDFMGKTIWRNFWFNLRPDAGYCSRYLMEDL